MEWNPDTKVQVQIQFGYKNAVQLLKVNMCIPLYLILYYLQKFPVDFLNGQELNTLGHLTVGTMPSVQVPLEIYLPLKPQPLQWG